VTEKELNLLQFSPGAVAQFSARPAQIMWRNVFQSGVRASVVDHMPDRVLADATAPYSARLADRSEDAALRDFCRRCPAINRILDPLS
jgi:hypothetical protein